MVVGQKAVSGLAPASASRGYPIPRLNMASQTDINLHPAMTATTEAFTELRRGASIGCC